MFAIAFDLMVHETEALHPTGRASKAYDEIAAVLTGVGFRWIQGSVYVSEDDDLAKLTAAMNALGALPWFPGSVRDLRAFRVELWSDFTPMFKGASSAPPVTSRGRRRPPSE